MDLNLELMECNRTIDKSKLKELPSAWAKVMYKLVGRTITLENVDQLAEEFRDLDAINDEYEVMLKYVSDSQKTKAEFVKLSRWKFDLLTRMNL